MLKNYLLVNLLLVTSLFADRILVEEVTEISKPFTEKIITGEQCYETTIEIPVNCGRDDNSIGVDTLVGATLGVALGSQIGKGHGNDAAKVVGGLMGANIANKNRKQNCTTYETVTKCNPTYEYKTSYKIVGFNNCSWIDNIKYCKQTKKPIEWLDIQKTYILK